jgi:3-hydroxybutyryl-CoA dehydrogenase
MVIRKVGVVGCGLMGSECVQACAQAGYQVVVSELSDMLLEKGLSTVNSNLAKSVKEGKMSSDDKNAIQGRISGTTDLSDFFDCDLVVENVFEIIDVKKKVFTELDKICPERTIFVTNTSVLSIIDIAAATNRSDKVLGIHGRLLTVPVSEVIRTLATSQDTLEIAKEFVKSLGLDYVIVPDVPGFMINRIWTPFLLSAVRVLEAGIASRDDIDKFFTKGFGLPMGPLASLDYGGLDSVVAGSNALYEETKDPQYAPPILLKKMVAAGWLGRKSGRGFYQYE